MSTQEEEEYLVTLAVLHGCAFYLFGSSFWYVRKEDSKGKVHEVESHHASVDPHGRFYWTSRMELAKDYCKFYGLGTHGGNNGPSNHSSSF
jgi:hypothetical protein